MGTLEYLTHANMHTHTVSLDRRPFFFFFFLNGGVFSTAFSISCSGDLVIPCMVSHFLISLMSLNVHTFQWSDTKLSKLNLAGKTSLDQHDFYAGLVRV